MKGDMMREPIQLEFSQEDRKWLRETILLLSEEEQRVLDVRFRLSEGGKLRTLAETAQIVGVPVARMRQIQNKAITMLRRCYTLQKTVLDKCFSCHALFNELIAKREETGSSLAEIIHAVEKEHDTHRKV